MLMSFDYDSLDFRFTPQSSWVVWMLARKIWCANSSLILWDQYSQRLLRKKSLGQSWCQSSFDNLKFQHFTSFSPSYSRREWLLDKKFTWFAAQSRNFSRPWDTWFIDMYILVFYKEHTNAWSYEVEWRPKFMRQS